MNKKGFITGWVVDMYAYIFALVVVVGFYFIFSHMATQHELALEGTKEDISLNIYANTFINMPVEVDGVKMNMAELLRLADQGSYNSEAKEHFNFYWRTVVFGKTEQYYIYIIGKDISFSSNPVRPRGGVPVSRAPKISMDSRSLIFSCMFNNKLNAIPIDNYLTIISGVNEPIYLVVVPSQKDLCARFG